MLSPRRYKFSGEDTGFDTHMRRFGCSISSSTEPTGDRSWDVRTFLVGVVAVAFAVVLNCLVSLWCRRVLNEPLSHRCRSVGRCRYSSYLRRTRRCQRAMVVMNLAMTEEKRKSIDESKARQSKYFGGIFETQWAACREAAEKRIFRWSLRRLSIPFRHCLPNFG